MDLLQMFPPASTFRISFKGIEHTIRLRKIALKDHLWCAGTFGKEIIQVIEQSVYDLDTVCRLIFHQMIEEDQKIFQGQEIEVQNGNELIRQKVPGHKILSILIDTEDKLQKILTAYTQCFNDSNHEKKDKKKRKFFKKKKT